MGARSKPPVKSVLKAALPILPLFVYVWYRSNFAAAAVALLATALIGLGAWLYVPWHFKVRTGKDASEMPADYVPPGVAVALFALILLVSGVWSYVFVQSI